MTHDETISILVQESSQTVFLAWKLKTISKYKYSSKVEYPEWF